MPLDLFTKDRMPESGHSIKHLFTVIYPNNLFSLIFFDFNSFFQALSPFNLQVFIPKYQSDQLRKVEQLLTNYYANPIYNIKKI